MNYIIKGVLKKIFTQYLYLKDNSLDLESGIIKLPAGFINHERLNHKLKPFKVRIASSSYKNLTIHVPLTQILSKPIKVSIEVLDISIERLYEEDDEKEKEETESQTEVGKQKQANKLETTVEQQRKQTESGAESRQNSGYFRNIINRLIYNMEVYMEKVNIRMTDYKEEEEFRQAFFTINAMSLKNSLIILEANIVKKTLNLALLHVRHSFGEVQIKDLNICLDFNNKKVALIAILNHLQLNIYKVPWRKLTRKMSKQTGRKGTKPTEKEKEKSSGSGLELSLFIKINSSKISSKLVELQILAFESTIKKSISSVQARLNFDSIRLGNNSKQPPIILVSYLPREEEARVYSQFEDSIIKTSFINFRHEKDEKEKLSRIEAKVYHLMVIFDCSQFKTFLDRLGQHQRQIEQVHKVIGRLWRKQKDKQNTVDIPQQSYQPWFSILIYRLMLRASYEQIESKMFGTVTLNTARPDEQPSESPLSPLKLGKKKSSLVRPVQEEEKDRSRICQKVKVLQFGVSIADYTVCALSEFQVMYDGCQVVLGGSSLISEMSLKLVKKMQETHKMLLRDMAYYHEKFKKFVQSYQSHKGQEGQERGSKKVPGRGVEDEEQQMPRLYLKVDQVVLRVGELSSRTVSEPAISRKQKPAYTVESAFISILQVQLASVLFSLLSSRVKLRLDFISYLYSPYTLQRKPITNQLQCSLCHHLRTQELSVALRNNLVVLIEDQYLNIVYKLFDQESVWCLFKNLTKETVCLVQESSTFQPIISQLEHSQSEDGVSQIGPDSEGKTYYHTTRIGAHQVHHLFWLNDQDFRLVIGHRRSQYVELHRTGELQFNACTEKYEQLREVHLDCDSDCGYVLRLLYNKLGNLTEVILDYKTHLVSFHQEYTVKISNCSYEVAIDEKYATEGGVRMWEGNWYHQLEGLTEDPGSISFTGRDGTQFMAEGLMANDQFCLYGLLPKTDSVNKGKGKVHAGYVLQTTYKNIMVNYTIMPFLVVRNQLGQEIEIEIVEKKSQERETFGMDPGQRRELSCNPNFDYYMKQFIVKLVLRGERGTHESDPFYFNTFTMVNQAAQTVIQLRSTQKNNYSRKTVVFEEGLLLKTKLITLKSSLKIVNRADFGFCLRIKQEAKEVRQYREDRDSKEASLGSEELVVGEKEEKEWISRLKKETVLQVQLINQSENKIELQYGELKGQKVLSFNFCKLKDRFYNLLFLAESRVVDGVELIEIDNFVEIVNLCRNVSVLSLQSTGSLALNSKSLLALSATPLSKYNNKAVELDDMNKLYAEIFMTAKVADRPLQLILDQTAVSFEELVKESSREVVLGRDRRVVTLLKEMHFSRITFYLTDRLYNPKLSYTLFSNPTSQNFLLADDSEYSHHFIVEEVEDQVRSTPPDKVFVQAHSFNSLVNRGDHELLLCDQDQKNLDKAEKKVLEKAGLRLMQYQFQAVTVYDCFEEEKLSVKKQLTTKGIEVRLKMFGKVELALAIKSLTFRVLENNKLDCLIQDISVRNEETKDHLLRVPEQTYFLFEGKLLGGGHFGLLKNGFIKCKNIIVNIKRQMPYSLISLVSNLGQKLGLRAEEEEALTPRGYREKVKRANGEARLRQYVGEMLLLVRNLFVHQVHLSLTIELESLSFSNVIILPQFELSSRFMRAKAFREELVTFYLTNLLAKFPKLSFLMSNFKNPINTLKLFFGIREAIKEKVEPRAVIHFRQEEVPDNPFLFSVQRWNRIGNYLLPRAEEVSGRAAERIVAYIYQRRGYLILTSSYLVWVEEGGVVASSLKGLERVRVVRSGESGEMAMVFRRGEQALVVGEQGKCRAMLSRICQLLL